MYVYAPRPGFPCKESSVCTRAYHDALCPAGWLLVDGGRRQGHVSVVDAVAAAVVLGIVVVESLSWLWFDVVAAARLSYLFFMFFQLFSVVAAAAGRLLDLVCALLLEGACRKSFLASAAFWRQKGLPALMRKK